MTIPYSFVLAVLVASQFTQEKIIHFFFMQIVASKGSSEKSMRFLVILSDMNK